MIDARTALDRVGDIFLLCRREGEPAAEIEPVAPVERLTDGDVVCDVGVPRVESADEIDRCCFLGWSLGPRTVDRRELAVVALAGSSLDGPAKPSEDGSLQIYPPFSGEDVLDWLCSPFGVSCSGDTET